MCVETFEREFPNAKLLAYGLLICWGNLIFGSNVVSVHVLEVLDLSSVFVASTLALSITYALFVFLFDVIRNMSYRMMAITGGVLISGPSAFLAFAPVSFPWMLQACFALAVLTGMGSAMLYLCCAHPYAQTPPRKSMLFTLFSLFLAVALYYVVSDAPDVVGKGAFCLLPLCSALLLPVKKKERIAPRTDESAEALPNASWRFVISIALIALILNVGVGYLSASAEYAALYSSASVGHLIALGMGGLLFIYVFRSEDSFDYCQIFYPVVLAAVVLLAFSYEFGPSNAFAVSLATGIRDISTIVIWCMLVYIMYHQKNVASIKIFLIGQTFTTFGSVVGNLAGTYFAAGGFTERGEATAFYLVLIIALVGVVTLVFPERVMKRLVAVDPLDLKILGSKGIGKSRPWQAKCMEYSSCYGLTPREQEVFMLVARGKSNEFIAKELVISSLTVKTHRQNVYSKMGVHSTQDLIDAIERSH